MARDRRLRRNFEERGSRVEDPDKAARARAKVSTPPAWGGAPAAERAVRERGETTAPPRRPTRPVARRPAKAPPKPVRKADRQLYAHERPPAEPLPERPDRATSVDRSWRPSDVPTEHTPSVAGFSLSAALLSIPISGLRFVVNLGMHAAYAVTRRLRSIFEQPLPD